MFNTMIRSTRMISSVVEQAAVLWRSPLRLLSTFQQMPAAVALKLGTTLAKPQLLSPSPCTYMPVQTYKVKLALKRRCPSCYFVQRGNRLFVECRDKPRHKQKQLISKRKLFRED